MLYSTRTIKNEELHTNGFKMTLLGERESINEEQQKLFFLCWFFLCRWKEEKNFFFIKAHKFSFYVLNLILQFLTCNNIKCGGGENFNAHLIALTYKVKVGKTMPEFLYNFYWSNKVACRKV